MGVNGCFHFVFLEELINYPISELLTGNSHTVRVSRFIKITQTAGIISQNLMFIYQWEKVKLRINRS